MIPGTGKETARLALAHLGSLNALAKMKPNAPYTISGGSKTWTGSVIDAQRNLKLAERRELVAAGKLPGSSPYAHAVALAVDLVWVGDRIGSAHLNGIQAAVTRALNDAATGAHSLWFAETGEAFMSFELEEDATLFRLALDA